MLKNVYSTEDGCGYQKNRMSAFPRRFYLLLVCLWAVALWAQPSDNPFDLVVAGSGAERVVFKSDNPFDLEAVSADAPPDLEHLDTSTSAGERGATAEDDLPAEAIVQPVDEAGSYRFKLFVSLFLALFAGILLSVYRSYFKNLYGAFTAENLLTLLLREQTKGIQMPYWAFYLLFFFSGGFSLYLLLESRVAWPLKPVEMWLLLSVGIFVIFSLKHLLLSLTGLVFPLAKPLGVYSFTIMVFNSIMGLYLVFVDVFWALGPESIRHLAFYAFVGGVILFYLYRVLRSLFIAMPYVISSPLHFLLYICAVELAPLLVVWRSVADKIAAGF